MAVLLEFPTGLNLARRTGHSRMPGISEEMTGSPRLVMLPELRRLVGKSEGVSLSREATRV